MELVNSKSKILFIGSYLGKERGSISIAEKLSAKFKDDLKFEIVIVSKRSQKLLRLFDIIYNLLFTNFSETFIDTYSGNSFFIARLAGLILRLRGKNYSLIIRGGNFVNYYNENESWIQKEMLFANSLISPSQFIINFFNKKGLSVEYLPNYIDQTNFPQPLDYSRKPFSLLWVRAFSEIYNPLIPIVIVSELKKNYPDLTLTMIGPDLGLLDSCKEKIKALNLESQIQIIGPVPNNKLFNFYQTHAVYLNTTSFESFGMALLEAASCGIPIVSTNVGEIPFIYEENESILLVDDFSITDFVSKIGTIFNSHELSSKLSLNGIMLSQKYAFTEIRPLWIKQFEKFNERYILNSKKSGLLFVGTFLSWKKGTKGPSELVSQKLRKLGYKTRLSSSYENKTLRLLDIFFSIIISGKKVIHIDVFSGPSFLITRYSVILAKLLRKKVLLNLHGGRLPEYFELNKETCSKTFNSVSKIYSPSKYLQTYFENLGFKINYLPNYINTNKFPFKATQNNYKILWVRAFSKVYQPYLAIEILEKVKKVYPQTSLTMIGPDLGLRIEIETQLRAIKLENSVEILGPINNNVLVKYYHEHSVYINTTLYESFGIALFESASSGLPIVTTNVGEIPYLWKDNEELLVDKTNTSEGMAECIISLFRNEEKRLNLAMNAKKKAEMFSWGRVEKLWEDLAD